MKHQEGARTTREKVFIGVTATVALSVAPFAIAYWEIVAWSLPAVAATTSLGRAAWIVGRWRTGELTPKRFRWVTRPVSFSFLLAMLSWVALALPWAALRASIYALSITVWLLLGEQESRKRARTIGLPSLAGRWRPLLDESMRVLGELVGFTGADRRVLGDPKAPELNLLQGLGILLAVLFTLGMAGFDAPVRAFLPGGKSPERGAEASEKDRRRREDRVMGGTLGEESPDPTRSMSPSPEPDSGNEGPETPQDCRYPDQHRQFLKGIRNDVGEAMYEAWEKVGVGTIGCLETTIERTGRVWVAPLTGWGELSGLVVSDVKKRAAVVFHQLRQSVEALIEDGQLRYVGERVQLLQGDFQVVFLRNGSCRLAIRHSFGDDVPYVFPPAAVSVLVMDAAIESSASPTRISESSEGSRRLYTVDFASSGSHAPPAAQIILDRFGRAFLAGNRHISANSHSPCPDVRRFDALASALE